MKPCHGLDEDATTEEFEEALQSLLAEASSRDVSLDRSWVVEGAGDGDQLMVEISRVVPCPKGE